jgi:hypothetical protein
MSPPSKLKMSELQTDPSQPTSEWGSVEELFGKQKSYFATDATKAYEWRIDQLDRLVRMLKENYLLLELGGQNPAIVDETANILDRQENCLGRDGMGRTVVHFTGLCCRS